MKHFKPGTEKVLSPRQGDFSNKWGKLVLQNAGVDNPNKAIKAKLVELWRIGYSHKDASIAISRMVV